MKEIFIDQKISSNDLINFLKKEFFIDQENNLNNFSMKGYAY